MSTKSIKITNGKILNYKISASGYKTIYGSQLITADTTINKNMIAESDLNGVYSLGDRIGGVASFVCYYTDGNNNKYAVFVLDAAYRSNGKSVKWSTEQQNTGLTQYNSVTSTEADNQESATQNTNYIMSTYYPSGTISNIYPVFKLCDDIILQGLNITAKLPNPYEASMIFNNKSALDALDPTLSSYAGNSLDDWKVTWVCYERRYDSAWCVVPNGSFSWAYKSDENFVIPVFEIPVE